VQKAKNLLITPEDRKAGKRNANHKLSVCISWEAARSELITNQKLFDKKYDDSVDNISKVSAQPTTAGTGDAS
jgi:hypothetical protein